MELPIIVIKPGIHLYHTTVKNLPNLIDDYPSLEYLRPDEPYSTDLDNAKYFSISPEAARYFASADVQSLGEIMVYLEYTTTKPLHLVDLTGYEHGEANNINRYVVDYNEHFDGIFAVDDEGANFVEVYLFQPYLCVDPNYKILSPGPITDYDGTNDIAKFRTNITNTYKAYV